MPGATPTVAGAVSAAEPPAATNSSAPAAPEDSVSLLSPWMRVLIQFDILLISPALGFSAYTGLLRAISLLLAPGAFPVGFWYASWVATL
eukprot:CAMPEP_0184729592 /NCGR_PEP_ID=MMETSP0314-20130426/44675_1 /TAXON_ID=38298 /ORGANISM="Rhodella maculata, Strain CCMP 736" /LENGTH=89 /DNA_ID=CAMNT_0027195637 /DNA_START=67 /DNA_END=333 /DNA_ORIENTATION=+